MTSDTATSLDLLPVELLYRIFDDLDAETILLSIRYVCKRFYGITQHYNRYTLNCQAMDKTKFNSIGNVTAPNNVTGLILSNDDQTPGQIELFLSLSPLEEYDRLETVTLSQIDQVSLVLFLDHLGKISTLASLTITSDSSLKLTDSTLNSLSCIMGQRTLRHLDLTLSDAVIGKLEWPNECYIEHLRVFHRLSVVTYATILGCAFRLRTLILKSWFVYGVEQVTANFSSSSLTSLSAMDCETPMSTIELMLSFTPSLSHLKLMSRNSDLCNGRQWEHFIQTKLPNLNRFELATQRDLSFTIYHADVLHLLEPFRTPFWLEEKQLFVTALGIPQAGSIDCFTLPDSADKIHLCPSSDKISISTAPRTESHLFSTDTMRQITMNLRNMDANKSNQVVGEW